MSNRETLIGATNVTLSRGDYSVSAAMGRDGMIHAGRLCGLASAWEHRGWQVTLQTA